MPGALDIVGSAAAAPALHSLAGTSTATLPVAGIVWILVLASVTVATARWLKLPYTAALVLVGVLVSALGLLPELRPTSEIILLVFLPPLLFQAALELELPLLGRALAAVLALSVPGVAVSALLVGLALAYLTPLGIWPALLFGAFISATDPVAVVASFRQLGAPAYLTMVVEGESLFNDGTALVLSALLLTAAQTDTLQPGEAALRLAWSIVGAGLIGVAAALAVSHATRLVDDHLVETTLSVALAYGSFLLANRVGASGALSVVFAGLVYGNYGRRIGLSADVIHFLDDFWGYLGFLANTVLFLLIGLEIHLSALWHNLRFVLLAIAIVLAARAVIVYSLTLSMHRLSPAYGTVIFWGGLRGGVALAVALSLPSSMPGHTLILALTYGVVLFTIVVQGMTIDPLTRRLGLLPRSPAPP